MALAAQRPRRRGPLGRTRVQGRAATDWVRIRPDKQKHMRAHTQARTHARTLRGTHRSQCRDQAGEMPTCGRSTRAIIHHTPRPSVCPCGYCRRSRTHAQRSERRAVRGARRHAVRVPRPVRIQTRVTIRPRLGGAPVSRSRVPFSMNPNPGYPTHFSESLKDSEARHDSE